MEINLMKPTAFLYWIQGALELGNVKRLNKNQIQMIKKHLEITEENYFKTWLSGFLLGKDKGLSEKQVNLLKEELAKAFNKVTDLNMGELSKLLQQPRKKYPWEDTPFLIGKDRIIC